MKHTNPWFNRIVGVIVICALVVVGFWYKAYSSTWNATATELEQGDRPVTVQFAQEDVDSSWDTDHATKINFSEKEITVDGIGTTVDGNVVTIIYGGVYELSGSMSNGQLIVQANDSRTVQLVMNGLDLTSIDSAPIYVKEAEKTILTLADHTINKLVDGTNYTLEGAEDDEPAALFSKDDLVINGLGALEVTGNHSNGIVSKDVLIIISGNITVNALQDGVRGRDSVEIRDGIFNITAGNDGIKSNNDGTEQDQIVGYIYIENGQFSITSAHDGLQAATNIVVIDGNYNIAANNGSDNGPERTAEMMGGPGGGGGEIARQNMDEDSMKEMFNQNADENGVITLPDGTELTEDQALQSFNQMTQQSTTEQPIVGQSTSEIEEVETGTAESDSYKGIKSAGTIWIEQGQFTLDTADDSIHADTDITILDGTFTISSGDDAIHAEANVTLYNGAYHIVTAYEGIEGFAIKIYDGDYEINVTDDGMNTGASTEEAGGMEIGMGGNRPQRNGQQQSSGNAAPSADTELVNPNATASPNTDHSSNLFGGGDTGGPDRAGGGGGMMEVSDGSSLDIYGGNIMIYSSGDGLDSNGDLTIHGGNVVAITDSSIGGDGGIDVSGTFTIKGGTILGAGPYEAKPAETSTQASIFYSASSASPEHTVIDIYDGETLLYTLTSELGFTNVMYSSNQLAVDSNYDLRLKETSNELTAQIVPDGTGEMGGMGGAFGGGGFGGGGGRVNSSETDALNHAAPPDSDSNPSERSSQ